MAWLKTQDLRIVKKYLEHLENHITHHNLLNKTQTISKALIGDQDLTEDIQIRLDNIDNLQIQGMLQAKRQCQKLHTRPYGIILLIQTIKYWRYLWKQVKGQPYHARILYCLKQALEMPNLENMTQEEIQYQLMNYKAQLQRQLGDPNCRQTWLKDLAMAQAKAHGTTPKKQLKQLI